MRNRLVQTAILAAVIAPSAVARAQCRDWAGVFGPSGQGFDGPVYSFVHFDPDGPGPSPSRLFAGGFFQTAGGVQAKGMAYWNGGSWSAVPGSPGGITSMVVHDDGSGPALFVAGQFNQATGGPGNAIAKWNGAAWSPLGQGLGNNAWALAVHDDGSGPRLYVGGDFTTAGGNPSSRLASWDGSTWRTFSGGPSPRTGHSAAFDPVSGRMLLFGGQPSSGAAGLGDAWTFDGTGWAEVAGGPPGRFDAPMVFDSLRNRIVMTGGLANQSQALTDTWVWNGTAWSQPPGAGAVMPARSGARAVYDAARDRVVLFGGQAGGAQLNDTWEFDGAIWQQAAIAAPPPARTNPGMSYDSVRQRVVMFGGFSSTLGSLGDTWEYDGAVWELRATDGPAPRYIPSMVFDGSTGETVLTGGVVTNALVNDTWAWDGSDWVELEPHNPALPDRSGPLVYDSVRGRLVQRTHLGQTWEWDGAAWALRTGGGLNGTVYALASVGSGPGAELFVGGSFTHAGEAVQPKIARLTASGWQPLPGFLGSAVYTIGTFDAGSGPEVYVGGNFALGQNAASLVRWTGSQWVQPGGMSPDGTVYALNTFDDGNGPRLYVGGAFIDMNAISGVPANGVSVWDGVEWLTPGHISPPARSLAAAAFDPVRRRTVVFGGTSSGGAAGGDLGDTWEFDGGRWSHAASSGPAPRYGHAAVYDPVRGKTLVIGGRTAAGMVFDDTWAWDGAQWALATGTLPGGGRSGHAVAFDSARARVVLFGGVDGAGTVLGDMLAWDGAAWSPVAGGGGAEPLPRQRHAMAYDESRDRMVLYGGLNAQNQTVGDLWEHDGTGWQQKQTFNSLVGRRFGHTMTYDQHHRGVAVLAGADGGSFLNTMAEWNGAAWVNPSGLFGSRAGHVSVYESHMSRHIAFGGAFQSFAWRDTQVSTPTSWDTAFPGASIVRALAGHEGVLFIGGQFAAAGGRPASNVSVWGIPCAQPVILTQPADRVAVFEQPVEFRVVAEGTGPLGYQWRKDGVDLSDGGNISGSRQSLLRLSVWSLNDEGEYQVVVRSPLGEVTSQTVTLTVPVFGGGGPVSVTPILIPPTPAPGMPAGHQFTDFASPTGSRTGDAVVLGYVSGPLGTGIRTLNLWSDGVLQMMFRHGDQAPGLPEGVFLGEQFSQNGVFSGWSTAGNGAFSFGSRIWGAGVSAPANNEAAWYHDSAGTDLVFRKGSQAPGMPAGVTYGSVAGGGGFSASAGTAVVGSLTGGGFNPSVDRRLWRWTRAAGHEVMAASLTGAPGTSAVFVGLGPRAMINASNTVAFAATLNSTTGYNYSGTLDGGVWIGQPGSVELAFKSGDPAPGTPPSTNLESFTGATEFHFNASGDVAFRTMVAGPAGYHKRAVYRWSEGELTPLVLEGQAAPGAPAGATFFAAFADAMNDAGDVVVRSNLQVPPPCPSPCANEGLWLARGLELRTIVVIQDPAPGAPVGTRISGAGQPVSLNSEGQVVFQATLSGPVSGQGIYGWTPGSGIFPIAIPGQQLETSPGVFRTVLRATISPRSGGSATGPDSANLADSGTVIFEVRFTDNLRGVFTGEFGEFAGGYFDCPAIIAQRQEATVQTGGTLVLSAEAVGTSPLTYQWRRNGVPLVAGGRISGVDTPVLTITGAVMADAGSYDLLVGNSCGSTATLPIPVAVKCYANCDGSTAAPILNVNDFICFMTRYSAGDPYANCDGSTIPPVLNVNDFSCFMGRYAAGCP